MSDRNYDELLKSANIAMLEKLKENEHKNGFEDIDIEFAINRITEETDELDIEFNGIAMYKAWKGKMHKTNYHKVRREAADVANFAAMIIYKCDQKMKEGEREAE